MNISKNNKKYIYIIILQIIIWCFIIFSPKEYGVFGLFFTFVLMAIHKIKVLKIKKIAVVFVGKFRLVLFIFTIISCFIYGYIWDYNDNYLVLLLFTLMLGINIFIINYEIFLGLKIKKIPFITKKIEFKYVQYIKKYHIT